jgi:hypothetical protein
MSMTEVKKGRRSWAPAEILQIHDLDENYRYKWANNDPANIQRLVAEGWEICSGVSGDKSKRANENSVHDGQKLSSVDTYRELVKLRMPKELAAERQAYFQEKADQQVMGLKAQAAKDMAQATHGRAGVRGSIVID